MAAVVVTPWVVRNKVQVGCYAITTDSRALWKANNENTREVLDRGGWIDDVPELPGAPPWPEYAADLTLAGQADDASTSAPRCGCTGTRSSTSGASIRARRGCSRSRRRACCGTRCRGSRTRAGAARRASRGRRSSRRSSSLLYAFAIVGVFVAPPRFVGLALLMLAYNTLAAMVFAGTARYRAPWDFLLAILAAFALASTWERLQARRHRHYVGAARARA